MQIDVDPYRWSRVCELAEHWTSTGEVPAIAFVAGDRNGQSDVVKFGWQDDAHRTPLVDDPIFLIASITKPIVGMAMLRLVEDAKVTLDDRVSSFIPDFHRQGKRGITIRQLLTHTSGLPDMLPNNLELRQAGAPLSEFVAGTCDVEPDFQPGFGVQYQSMGFCILGELIQRISGAPCRDFVRREFFKPLGMTDTSLGAAEDWYAGDQPKVDRIVQLRLPREQSATDSWNWNGRYWRGLGAPWGGMLTTPTDLAKFARMLLDNGSVDGLSILAPATIEAATRNQIQTMPNVPEAERRCKPWGLGWRLNWPSHSANFGDFLGPRAFGHWGATGTLMWVDPERQRFLIVLTTQPQEPRGEYLARLSNAVCAAFQPIRT